MIACSVRHTGDIRLDRSHISVWKTDEEHYVPLTCHHCETPSCALACPTKACSQESESLRVVIDGEKCIGCRTCVVACPFGHAHYDRASRVSVKCDYCNGEPECERVCEPGAIAYVPSDEIGVHKRRAAPLALSTQRLNERAGKSPRDG